MLQFLIHFATVSTSPGSNLLLLHYSTPYRCKSSTKVRVRVDEENANDGEEEEKEEEKIEEGKTEEE